VLLLKLLRNQSIEMSFPKSDSPTEFHEFNLSIADPMAQRPFRNAQVYRCSGEVIKSDVVACKRCPVTSVFIGLLQHAICAMFAKIGLLEVVDR
jgi:hypothetical protein